LIGWLEKRLYWLWGWLPLPQGLRWAILRAANTQFLVGVAAVTLDEAGRTLFFKHTYRPGMPWGLPGGWLKKGEDPARAVEREIREESGLGVKVVQPLWVEGREHAAGLEVIFLARPVGGVFTPSAEVCEARYFALDELPPVFPETAKIVALALARARERGQTGESRL